LRLGQDNHASTPSTYCKKKLTAGQKRPAKKPQHQESQPQESRPQESQPQETQHGPAPARGMEPEGRPTSPIIPPITPSWNSTASATTDNPILDAAQDLFVSRSPSSVLSNADEPMQTPEYDQDNDNANDTVPFRTKRRRRNNQMANITANYLAKMAAIDRKSRFMTILFFKFDPEVADRLIRSVWGSDIDPDSVDYDASWRKIRDNMKRYKNETLRRLEVSFQKTETNNVCILTR